MQAHGLSVYDQGMLNKGLETFQLLLLEQSVQARRTAASVMDAQVPPYTHPRPTPIISYHLLIHPVVHGAASFSSSETRSCRWAGASPSSSSSNCWK